MNVHFDSDMSSDPHLFIDNCRKAGNDFSFGSFLKQIRLKAIIMKSPPCRGVNLSTPILSLLLKWFFNPLPQMAA